MRMSNTIVSKTLALVGSMIRPGMTGKEIDDAAETFIRDNGGIPSFKGYAGSFPASLCVSRNEVVVHGIPTEDLVFQDGDIVSVDCGVYLNGFHGDSAYTFPLGEVSEEAMELCRVTNTSLYLAIEQAVAGNRLGDISHAVQHYTEKDHKYSVVRELVGHGIGRNLHEAPDVPNFGKRGRGPVLRENLVIAIEPMINLGQRTVRTASDGWTVFAKDRKWSAHYEHSVAIKKDKADILSNHSFIEEAIQQNPNVREVGVLSEALA